MKPDTVSFYPEENLVKRAIYETKKICSCPEKMKKVIIPLTEFTLSQGCEKEEKRLHCS